MGNNEQVIIGIDLGFSQVKVYWGNGSAKFASISGPITRPTIMQSKYDNVLDNLTLTYDKRTYAVGEKALREIAVSNYQTKASKISNKEEQVKYFTALALVSENLETSEFTVVTGLPVDEYLLYRKPLREHLEGDFVFDFCGIQKNIKVNHVEVIPQAIGAYFDYILAENEKQQEIANQKVMIIDVGFRTTDVVTMYRGNEITEECYTIFQGVRDIHTHVVQQLQGQGIRKNFKEMNDAVRSNFVEKDGKNVNIKQVVDDACEMVCNNIMTELFNFRTSKNYDDISFVLLTGGGANLLGGFFKDEFLDRLILMNDPEFNNARGYYRFGQIG